MDRSGFSTPVQQIRVRALTQAAFEPFGEVLQHAGDQRRRYLALPFAHDPPAHESRLWISRVTQADSVPLSVRTLERHPWSAQTFIPLTPTPYLVVVAPTGADGLPDLDRIQAFEACADQGVCYRPRVWHHGLSVLTAPAQFVVTMTVSGSGGDDEFWTVPRAIEVIRASSDQSE